MKLEASSFKEWNKEQDDHYLQNDHPELTEISELDLFKLYFDAELNELLLDSSVQYVKQKNDQKFEIDWSGLWGLITIMTVFFYNVIPQLNIC